MSYHDSCYVLNGPSLASESKIKVIGLDLDWTLIRPRNSLHGVKEDDWMMIPHRISMLKNLATNGYHIAIFTNQKYKGKALAKRIMILRQVHAFLTFNEIPSWLFAATLGDNYRKPENGMWELFLRLSGAKVDVKNSFYVGDAAGRVQDFSDSDLKFSQQIGVNFLTPESLFQCPIISLSDDQTMFILVGMPGSGKSTYCETYLVPAGWCHVEQDKLKTVKKMLQTVEQCLKNGRSVVIDATNPTIEHRGRYLELASKYDTPSAIVHFNGNGYAFNKLRDKSKKVPDVVYHKYMKMLEVPTPDEGVQVFDLV